MMDAFEKKIAEALDRDAAEAFEKMGADQSIFEMMIGGFRGRNLWLNVVMSVVMLLSIAFSVYCTVRFFQAESTREMFSWGFGAFMAFFVTSFMKLWFWLEMQKNSIVREVKRVEVQVASLATRLGGDAG
jgi:Family of unknown function (DUF6768)